MSKKAKATSTFSAKVEILVNNPKGNKNDAWKR